MPLLRFHLLLQFVPVFVVDAHVADLFFFHFMCHFLRNHAFVCLPVLLFLLFFFFLAFVFSLSDDKLIGCDAFGDEVDVEYDEVKEQEGEDAVDYSTNPGHCEGREEIVKLSLCGEDGDGGDVENEEDECGDYHGEEGVVVGAADAVIDPHAVMVEILNATTSPNNYRSHALQCRDFYCTKDSQKSQ
jgi:hypothetical protein